MTRNFCRWEVDPFFSAAEEVQDSSDRLESAYRTWIHTKALTEIPEDGCTLEFRRRELSTALGTAKWQLEEFERAVSGSAAHDLRYVGEDAPERHKQFVEAIRNNITSIEKALLDSEDLKSLPVMKLDQEDKDDLAQFLSGARLFGSHVARGTLVGFSIDQKADGEDLSSLSGSMESKSGMSHKSSVSASSSETALLNAESMKPRAVSGSDNLCVDRLSVRGKTATDFLEIRCGQSDQAFSDPASERMHGDRNMHDGDRGEEHTERVNGQHRSVSVGSGLNSWKSGQVLRNAKMNERVQLESGSSGLNLWSLFRKKQHALQLKISKSGFKRWKDGDANNRDRTGMSCYYKLMRRTGDIEKGFGDIWQGANSNCLGRYASGGTVNPDGKLHQVWGEAMQILQRPQYALPSTRPVQIASAILVALGLVGLLSFHVTTSAF